MGNAKFRNNVHVIFCSIKFGTHKKFALRVPERKHNLEVGMQRFFYLVSPMTHRGKSVKKKITVAHPFKSFVNI